jgi:UDP-N-acetylglucosamine diphosphorylase/glucosamine-1-phosphate N-acetyltransferase
MSNLGINFKNVDKTCVKRFYYIWYNPLIFVYMENVILFDDEQLRKNLLPFTYTRAIADIRIGITTIKEKWNLYYADINILTESYLQEKYGVFQQKENTLYINASLIPSDALVSEINSLKENELLTDNNIILAYKNNTSNKIAVQSHSSPLIISQKWDIFQQNEKVMTYDFEKLTKGRKSQVLSETNTLIGDTSKLFIEEGAYVEASVLNTNTGVIYIGKDAEVMEGSVIRGPLAMCEHAATKLCTKIYGATTLGPHVKVGGEVNNSVIFGYSNKGHDGFLGNSVLGEWCNLGADTNNSNLKNNYGEIKVWNYDSEKEENSGLQFCGLMMGDHSKSGINTMFNTGTVVGVCANVFGADFPAKHIPSYTWGGAESTEGFKLDKAYEVAERMMERRKIPLTDIDRKILKEVFNQTKKYRN